MRRLIPILLIIAVLIEIAGFYCIYVIKQCVIKASAETAIQRNEDPENELRLSFKVKNNVPQNVSFRWTEDDEFMYNGMMYDVRQQEIKGDSIILYCYSDGAEVSLIEKFKSLFSGKPDHKSAGNNSGFLQFLSAVFIPAEKNEISPFPQQILVHSFNNTGNIIHMSYEILKPPPQTFLA